MSYDFPRTLFGVRPFGLTPFHPPKLTTDSEIQRFACMGSMLFISRPKEMTPVDANRSVVHTSGGRIPSAGSPSCPPRRTPSAES